MALVPAHKYKEFNRRRRHHHHHRHHYHHRSCTCQARVTFMRFERFSGSKYSYYGFCGVI
jgi:hypothetical protein